MEDSAFDNMIDESLDSIEEMTDSPEQPIDGPNQPIDGLDDPALIAELDETSQPYVGRWNQLVSTTNWEKGAIILQWREALIAADAPVAEYSDEAWARRVGGVTGQHVGRLRRVYQRFGSVSATYEGLYWSHFQAALDWEDAEMWLEGAVQSNWSVSQMRRQRWETVDGGSTPAPDDNEIVSGELDEDFEPALNEQPGSRTLTPSYGEVQSGPLPEGPDFGDEDGSEPAAKVARRDSDSAAIASDDEDESVTFVRPFENLSELPDDLAEAFEHFKLAILRHKLDGWKEISRDDLLASLDALKELAMAPSSEESPF
ncbi:MAG: hypothetical protein R3C99_07230 [Pirellulaceae bacterium]